MKLLQLLGSLFWQTKAKLRSGSMTEERRRQVIDNFHQLYYDLGAAGRTWTNTRWMGTLVAKCPFDLWVYQEILHELRPDLIIETGTATGGSALFMAALCDLLGRGRIVTVDIAAQERLAHPRVRYVTGSSIGSEFVSIVEAEARQAKTVLVVLDSDHSRAHVLEELRIFQKFVTPGSYMIVEDSNVYGHPVFREHGPGPYEAVAEFLKETRDFEVDLEREKFMVTFNPNGYLRRKSAGANGRGER